MERYFANDCSGTVLNDGHLGLSRLKFRGWFHRKAIVRISQGTKMYFFSCLRLLMPKYHCKIWDRTFVNYPAATGRCLWTAIWKCADVDVRGRQVQFATNNKCYSFAWCPRLTTNFQIEARTSVVVHWKRGLKMLSNALLVEWSFLLTVLTWRTPTKSFSGMIKKFPFFARWSYPCSHLFSQVAVNRYGQNGSDLMVVNSSKFNWTHKSFQREGGGEIALSFLGLWKTLPLWLFLSAAKAYSGLQMCEEESISGSLDRETKVLKLFWSYSSNFLNCS